MVVAFILFGGFVLGISSDAYKEYAKHSNGNASFQIILTDPCPPGLRPSGYALSVNETVLLKQRNYDGTVGAVCEPDSISEK